MDSAYFRFLASTLCLICKLSCPRFLLLARDVEKPPRVNSRLVFMCASKYRCALCLPDAPIPSLWIYT